jgi:hypothetical protein
MKSFLFHMKSKPSANEKGLTSRKSVSRLLRVSGAAYPHSASFTAARSNSLLSPSHSTRPEAFMSPSTAGAVDDRSVPRIADDVAQYQHELRNVLDEGQPRIGDDGGLAIHSDDAYGDTRPSSSP